MSKSSPASARALASEHLHDLRNGLGRLSACAELMALRGTDLDEDQRARLDSMKAIIAEIGTVTGVLERALEGAATPGAAEGGLQDRGDAQDTQPEAGGLSASAERAAAEPASSLSPAESELAPTVPSNRSLTTPPTLPSSDTSPDGMRPGHGPEGAIVAGTYRIMRLLGRGGMGSVWLTRDEKLHRDVALKLVDLVDWGGVDARRVFLREARAMAQVQHPNVVTIHAFGEHEGVPYFVMEYIPGTSLERLLTMHGRDFGFDEAIAIVDQVCRGVEAIHRAGALHCDVKPANVLIGPDFHVAVADLGLARTVGERRGTRGGTPGYVAPEIIADEGAPPDERADIYAVGALAYKLLTGKSAFAAEKASDTIQRQLDGHLALPSAVSDLPGVFDEILVRALSREPADRHPSAEAFRRELGAARDALPRTYRETTVFVVDDEAELREHARALVERALPGARVRGFPDGRHALEAVERDGTPHIAIVDLEMPDINGVELTAALKSQRGGSRVDVVMLTGAGSARDWELLQRLGASGFLFKPVDESELHALMRRLAVTDDG